MLRRTGVARTAFGDAFGCLFVPFGALGEYFGAHWGSLECLWSSLGAPWGTAGVPLGSFGPSGCSLGPPFNLFFSAWGAVPLQGLPKDPFGQDFGGI